MPEFIPEHTPDDIEPFVADYLAAAEWLLDDEVDRAAINGWSKEAIADATKDCEDFQEANKADLETHEEKTGFTGGNDFWLTRNHHGAGFWDRGTGEAGDRLTKAAHVYGASDAYMGDDGFLYLM